jgi:hypothetical protein
MVPVYCRWDLLNPRWKLPWLAVDLRHEVCEVLSSYAMRYSIHISLFVWRCLVPNSTAQLAIKLSRLSCKFWTYTVIPSFKNQSCPCNRITEDNQLYLSGSCHPSRYRSCITQYLRFFKFNFRLECPCRRVSPDEECLALYQPIWYTRGTYTSITGT